METVKIPRNDIEIGNGRLVLIAGPCMAESRELCLETAAYLRDLCGELDIGYVFKASFDKANRSSGESRRGPGLVRGLEFLAAVREEIGEYVPEPGRKYVTVDDLIPGTEFYLEVVSGGVSTGQIRFDVQGREPGGKGLLQV